MLLPHCNSFHGGMPPRLHRSLPHCLLPPTPSVHFRRSSLADGKSRIPCCPQHSRPDRRQVFASGGGGRAVVGARAMPTQTAERCSFVGIAPLEAVLFDIDGTLCDSDPIHYFAFREMLQEIGYNNGVPITEGFFVKHISGKHNDDIAHFLFPEWDHEKAMKFMDDKEAMFRRLAVEKLKPVNGIHKLCKWIMDRRLKRAAVSNAPRANAELMISILGLSDFFDLLVLGSECERAKPFPDPYLRALKVLGVSAHHSFIFEDSASGINAGVAAGMPVVGLTTRNPEELLMKAGATFLIKDYEDPKLWMTLEEEEKAATAAFKA